MMPPSATAAKKAFSLVSTMTAMRTGIGREPAEPAGALQIFPEQPEGEQRPEGEYAIHQLAVRHHQLERGDGHQRGDDQRHAGAAQPEGEDAGEQKTEAGKDRRHAAQRHLRPAVK